MRKSNQQGFSGLVVWVMLMAFAQLPKAQEVISSLGGLASSTSMTMSYTVGESFIGVGAAGSIQMTQGFHQNPVLVNSIRPSLAYCTFLAYPNPSGGMVTLACPRAGSADLYLRLYDIQGMLVRSFPMTDPEVPMAFDLTGLSSGLYLLQAVNDQGGTVGIVRLVKF